MPDQLSKLGPLGSCLRRRARCGVRLGFTLVADRGQPPPLLSGSRTNRLRLAKGQRIAYVFDFGDEWRVRLTLRQIIADDGGMYPRLLESVGEAPPQYPDCDEEDAA